MGSFITYWIYSNQIMLIKFLFKIIGASVFRNDNGLAGSEFYNVRIVYEVVATVGFTISLIILILGLLDMLPNRLFVNH